MLRKRKKKTKNKKLHSEHGKCAVLTTFPVAQCHKRWSIYLKGWCIISWGNFQEEVNRVLSRDNWAREQSPERLASSRGGVRRSWKKKKSCSDSCFGQSEHEPCNMHEGTGGEALPLSAHIFVSWAKNSQQPLVHPCEWLKAGESSDWMIQKRRGNFAALAHASSWEPERKDSLWFSFGFFSSSQY